MGPSPSESSLKEGIVAALKRARKPEEDENNPPLKRRDSLTSSCSTSNPLTSTVGKPPNTSPQIPASKNSNNFEDISDHDGATGMVVDPHTHGTEFESPSLPTENVKNNNIKKSTNTNKIVNNLHGTKSVTFKEDVNDFTKSDLPPVVTPSPVPRPLVSKREKPVSVVKLAKDIKKYDICEDLKNVQANVTFAQVLEMSNQVRTDLVNNLKKEKSDASIVMGMVQQDLVTPEVEVVNNPYHDYLSKAVDEHDIAAVQATINGMDAFLLVDACSNANIVSKKFLDEKIKEYQIIGKIDSRIQQALQDDVPRTYDLVELEVSIGHVKFPVLFKVSYNENPFYDALIGLKVQHDNRIMVDTVDKVVSLKSQKGTLEPLTPIIDINSLNERCCFCYLIPKKDDSTTSIDNTSKSKHQIIQDIVDDVEKMSESFHTEEDIETEKLRDLLVNFIDVIACSADDLQPSKLSPHHIELEKDAKPIKSKVRKMSQVQLIALKNIIIKLINQGILVPSYSSWASPVVMVPKKNNDWRLCADYRKVNNVTKKDAYAIPNIREAFESMSGAAFFTAIDLFSGYHQIPMLSEDQDITAITTKFGNFNYVVMPFGLTNAPATFQREMNRIFFPLLNVCVQVYIDDIIVYSPSFDQHLKDLEEVFKILRDNRLKINIEKCLFCRQEIEVLGHLVSIDGLRPIPSKLDTIRKLPSPTSITELRSFLGMVGYYRDFIDNFSSITAPLNKLLRKNVPFVWTKECEEAVKRAITSLSSAPILSFPRYDRPLIIRSDASYNGIGGALLQLLEDGVEHPIRFVSRTLKKSERNYAITELEGTAAHYCLQEFSYYILGNPYKTILYTDHQPLVALINKTPPQTSKHARWINDFSQSQVEVRYQPGKENKLADALSRLTLKEEESKVAVINAEDNNFDEGEGSSDEEPLNERKQRIRTEHNDVDTSNVEENASESENNILEVVDEQENNKYMTDIMKSFLKDRIITIENQLYFRDGENLRKIVEEPVDKIKIISKGHNIAHEGIQKTYQRIKEQYYWKNMILDIKKYVSSCRVCQLKKSQPVPPPMEKFATPVEAPFVRIAVDIIGPLKPTTNGHKYIIVAVDYFTKWTEAKALVNTTSEDVMEFLIEVFSRHGLPQLVFMDNGVQFTSDYTKISLDLYDTYVHFVSIYHPESNGLVENKNREIGKQLRFLVEENQDWDKYLPLALWALRTSVSVITGFSSFELLYGRRATLPLNLILMETYSEDISRNKEEIIMEQFIEHAKWVRKAALKMLGTLKYWEARRQSKISMKNKCDYNVGDIVKLRKFNRTKLEPYFIGPYVIKDIYFNTVKLQDYITGKDLSRYVHFKNILPFNL